MSLASRFVLCLSVTPLWAVESALAQERLDDTVDSRRASERLVGRPVLEAHGVVFVPSDRECVADQGRGDCASDVLLGGELGAFYAPAAWVSIGGVGSLLVRPGAIETNSGNEAGFQSTEVRRLLAQASAQGRFHPISSRMFVPWAGPEFGVAVMRTSTVRAGFPQINGTLTDSKTVPVFGAGAGVDAWLSERLALMAQVRLLRMPFDGSVVPARPGEDPYYPSQTWFSFGLGARLAF